MSDASRRIIPRSRLIALPKLVLNFLIDIVQQFGWTWARPIAVELCLAHVWFRILLQAIAFRVVGFFLRPE